MNTFLVIVLVALMGATVFALVRGIIAFLQTTREDLESGSDVVTELQLKQNKMMFARIKYQALAIVVVVLIMLMAR
jgi:hypothetical protein